MWSRLLSRLLFVYPRDLYNAATSRTLVNAAFVFGVNISLILNSFIIEHYLIKKVILI